MGDCLTKLEVYHSIYENNSRKKCANFFKDELIEILWPYVMKNLTVEVCFPAPPKVEDMKSHCKVTEVMRKFYKMPLPQWWIDCLTWP